MRPSRIVVLALAALLVPAARSQCKVVQMTAAQARLRMMNLLHIKTLRPGYNGNPKAPNAANYDEAKAGPFSKIPDALVLNDGKRVTSAAAWWKVRRPQLVTLFNQDIYGYMPKDIPPVQWRVVSVKHELNGKVPVITKQLVGHVQNPHCPSLQVNIQLTLSTPAQAKGPVPVIMNLDISPEVMAMFRKRFPQFFAHPPKGPTWQQQALAHGWGYASYIPTSVQPDTGAGLTEGIIGLMNNGQPRQPDQWGALRAWAWGASQALNYFETDKAVNAHKVAIAGHSRYGKAALVAMAYDHRFAAAYISSSGEAGAKLWRHHYGEGVGNIADTQEFHWMAGNFLRYDGPLTVKDLPIDANELIALCAPRPVFISGGATAAGDGWVDAKGMFIAESHASPVYRLLGVKGLGTTVFPHIGTPLTTGTLAFRQHHQGHTPAPNWPYFMNWAKRWLD